MRTQNGHIVADRILWNAGGKEIDEIVVDDCSVHIEQMTDTNWWMAIYKGDARFVVEFQTAPGRRKRMTCWGYADSNDWHWDEDREHEPNV